MLAALQRLVGRRSAAGVKHDNAGKRFLGVGCGPRGSLEWAEHAAERIGLEPLADEYVRLHERRQAMTYVQRVCERIPFGDDLDATLVATVLTRRLIPGGYESSASEGNRTTCATSRRLSCRRLWCARSPVIYTDLCSVCHGVGTTQSPLAGSPCCCRHCATPPS